MATKYTYYYLAASFPATKEPLHRIGLARTRDARLHYADAGYRHVTRDAALRIMRNREIGPVVVSLDGLSVTQTPFWVARALKNAWRIPVEVEAEGYELARIG